MSANYVSPKADGYVNVRNNIYRERQVRQKEMVFKMQGALRDLPEQTKENYVLKEFK